MMIMKETSSSESLSPRSAITFPNSTDDMNLIITNLIFMHIPNLCKSRIYVHANLIIIVNANEGFQKNKPAKLRRHASQVHFAKIHFG